MINYEFTTLGLTEHFATPAPRMTENKTNLNDETMYCSGVYGNITFKQYVCRDCVIWIREFDLQHDITIRMTSEAPFLAIYIIAYGNIPHFAKGLGDIFFGEQEYNIVFGQQLECVSHLKKGYHCVVDIHYSLNFLEKWSLHLRPLRDFLDKRDECAAGKIFQVNPKLSSNAMELIRRVENCKDTGEERLVFIGNKGLELLLMSVCPNDAVSYDSYNLKKDEVDKIKKVKDYLLASYEEPMDMKKLVRLSGLNEWSLRKGFKLLYGMPVYKFLLSKRMEVAKELLSHENLSVTEVAYHLGYGNHSNFINAFKKVMGFPPGKLKRGD